MPEHDGRKACGQKKKNQKSIRYARDKQDEARGNVILLIFESFPSTVEWFLVFTLRVIGAVVASADIGNREMMLRRQAVDVRGDGARCRASPAEIPAPSRTRRAPAAYVPYGWHCRSTVP